VACVHVHDVLEWHLATQVMYCVAAVLIVVCEILARVHICCDEERNTRNFAALGILVLVAGACAAFINTPAYSSSLYFVLVVYWQDLVSLQVTLCCRSLSFVRRS